MRLRKLLLAVLIVLLGVPAFVSRADDTDLLQDRGEAPELTNTNWLNTEKPVHLADLRGKVVLLDFWTFGCINCYHTLPYIKDVYARLADKGVQVIGIHFPETGYEHNVDNVKAFVQKEDIQYPIAIDNDGASWNAYEMHAWPAVEIIDKNGHRRFRQLGEGNYQRIEQALSELLAEPYEPILKKSEEPLVAQDSGVAPEIADQQWLNTDAPLALSNLHGKVVLVEFWTFGCINCYHTLDAMRDWYAKYQGKGLVQIGVHFPEFSYERDVNNVKDFLQKEGIKYPVAIDNDGATWRAYSQLYWPTIYLIDKAGHIRYKVIGEHDYSQTEKAIQALLTE